MFPTALVKKLVTERLHRCTVGISVAIRYRKTEKDKTLVEKVQFLKKDILNTVNHVFGDHSKCEMYFCKADEKEKEGEVNLVNELKDTLLLQEIISAHQIVAHHAPSLIEDVDTNIVSVNLKIVLLFNNYFAVISFIGRIAQLNLC